QANRNLSVKEIRLTTRPSYIAGRHPALNSNSPTYNVEVEIVGGHLGPDAVGSKLFVYFGLPGRRTVLPYAPTARSEPYVIIYHFDQAKRRRLVGLPVTQSEFEKWKREYYAHPR